MGNNLTVNEMPRACFPANPVRNEMAEALVSIEDWEDFQSSALPTELSSHITWQRSTLPHGHPCSTIDAVELNCPVRNGKECFLYAIITRCAMVSKSLI